MSLLNPGDPFPRLTISTTDDQTLTIPDAFAGDFAVVLFYRGAWCPYCNAQLRAFERASQTLADNGIRVAVLSVDDKETSAALVAKHQLTFPVGYGADAAAVAALTGAFVIPDPAYLQSTGFVLGPRPRRHSQQPQPGGMPLLIAGGEVAVVVDRGVDHPQRDEPPVDGVVPLRGDHADPLAGHPGERAHRVEVEADAGVAHAASVSGQAVAAGVCSRR